MHRSWGNAISADEALDSMGADVMRWMFSEANPSQNIRFGYGPANDVKRRLLTLWNSVVFFTTYANIEGFRPTFGDLDAGPQGVELRPLDRWLLARTQAYLVEAEGAYDRYWTPDVVGAFERFVDDVSNWYIRRSRRRFYSLDEAAFRTLWYALVQALRGIAPVMPFLAEHLWQKLGRRARARTRPARCTSPDGRLRRAASPTTRSSTEVGEVRRVVELGYRARSASGLKLRQPLRRLIVQGAPLAEGHLDEIASELRVKEVEAGRSRSDRTRP